ncbi:MAG: hypothetical protein WCC64_20555 [Aliidongia sp.]
MQLPTVVQNEVADAPDSAGLPAVTLPTFTSPDPLVGNAATNIETAIPGSVNGVGIPIGNTALGLSSDADIALKIGDIVEVKSGGGKGTLTQVKNQQRILGNSGEVLVYGPNLKGSVVNWLKSNGIKVFTDLNDLISYIKSKGN